MFQSWLNNIFWSKIKKEIGQVLSMCQSRFSAHSLHAAAAQRILSARPSDFSVYSVSAKVL